jgi:hypothetical protein
MNEVIDHIAALVLEFAKRNGGSYSAFAEDLSSELEKLYGLTLAEGLLNSALARLAVLEAVQILPSAIAGDLIQISPDKALEYYALDARVPGPNTPTSYDEKYNQAHNDFQVLKAYSFGGQPWVERVIARLKTGEVENVSDAIPEQANISIPASDRIVRLNDNQAHELVDAIDDVASSLQRENSIGGDGELRGRFLGQLAAGRELVRAQSVRAYLLYEALVRMLGTLIQKYKGQALGEAAKTLLKLLIENVLK